jgi:superfamily II DNA/RNA helicase
LTFLEVLITLAFLDLILSLWSKALNFSEFNLDPSLKSAIEKLNYSSCTPIQELSIPVTLEGRDVAGLAQTGTGKTAAFLLPIMERILRARPLPPDASEETKALVAKRAFPDWKPQNFVLILVPTRELAEQVYESVEKLSEFSGLRGFAIYGGTGYDKQKDALKNGVEFIVATPGRLIDLFKEHLVDLKQVRAIIFDEADRMFDMGFKDDMKYILQRVPKERQFLVFSATLNFDVLNTAYQFGADPVEVNISRDQAKADNVKDEIFHVGQDEKPQHLLSLIKLHKPRQAIIFTNFKMNVEKITRFLNDNGVPAMAISSLLTQAQRTKVMAQFKAENDLNILVATDVAARGLDVLGVDMVVNFELPMDSESYVHRIGRTGRAGTTGIAFSLVSDRDVDSLGRIEEYLKHKVEVGYLEDKDLLKDFKPFIWSDSSYSRSYESRDGGGAGGGGGRDRGPRREGGGSGGRGPRREGGSDRRPDRGPRREPRADGQQPREARADGQPREPRRDGPREPRRDGNRTQVTKRGPDQRTDQRRQHPNQQGAKPAHSGTKHASGQQNRGPRKPHPSQVAKQKSITQRVSGFLKKLFS